MQLVCSSCCAPLAEGREGEERRAKHIAEHRAIGEYSVWLMPESVGGTAQQLPISPGLISEKQHLSKYMLLWKFSNVPGAHSFSNLLPAAGLQW